MRDVEYNVGPAQILTIFCCCSRPAETWEGTERRQWDPSLLKRVFSSLSLLFQAHHLHLCWLVLSGLYICHPNQKRGTLSTFFDVIQKLL